MCLAYAGPCSISSPEKRQERRKEGRKGGRGGGREGGGMGRREGKGKGKKGKTFVSGHMLEVERLSSSEAVT
jgi:hypothetical protein